MKSMHLLLHWNLRTTSIQGREVKGASTADRDSTWWPQDWAGWCVHLSIPQTLKAYQGDVKDARKKTWLITPTLWLEPLGDEVNLKQMSLLAFHQSHPDCGGSGGKARRALKASSERGQTHLVHMFWALLEIIFQPHWINCLFSVHLTFSPAGEEANTLWVINA